jgi:hypothetical protein
MYWFFHNPILETPLTHPMEADPDVVEALSLRGITLRVLGADHQDSVTVCISSFPVFSLFSQWYTIEVERGEDKITIKRRFSVVLSQLHELVCFFQSSPTLSLVSSQVFSPLPSPFSPLPSLL